jgi:hypothetical protein
MIRIIQLSASKKNTRQRYSNLVSGLSKFFMKSFIFLFILFGAGSVFAAQTQIISTNITHPNFQITLQPDPQATTIYLLAGNNPWGTEFTFQAIYPLNSDQDVPSFANESVSANFNIPTNTDRVHITVITMGGNSPLINQSFSTDSSLSITSPVNGSVLTDKRSKLFWDWSAGILPGAFQVSVGTYQGGSDILNQVFESSIREVPIDIELNGLPVFLKIDTTTGYPDSDEGVKNYSVSASYQTATSGVDSGTHIISPISGSTLNTQTTNIQWVADPLASTLLITLGSTPGANDIVNQVINDPSSNQLDITVPLTGNTIYMDVTTTWANGVQYIRSYQYQTADSDIGIDSDGDGMPDSEDPYPLQSSMQCFY